jgi:Fe2+ transport system protein B
MAERLRQHEQQPHTGEHLKNHEAAEAKKNLERIKDDAEKASKNEKHRDLTEIHKSIEEKALDSDKVVIDKEDETPAQPILGVQRELKADAYKRTLKTVQRELKPTERTFSKVIHQPLVETISNVSEKTVARPSALLGGGITALLGSSIVLYMSKHYGFPYNTFLFFALFVAGFGLGVLIEFALRFTVQKRSARRRRA